MPEIEPVVAQRGLPLRGHAAKHPADLRAAAEQERGLPADDLEVLFFGDVDVAGLRELIQLTFDHPQRHVAEQPDDLQRILRQRHRHRLDVEVVAEQHGDVVAPARVHGKPAAPEIGAIDDVVVDERRGVDELDHRRVEDGAVPLIAAEPGRHAAARPDAPVCRRSSGCSVPSPGSGRPATECGGRTRARLRRDLRGSARRSATRSAETVDFCAVSLKR